MTQEIKRIIRKRDSLYDKYKRLRRPTDRCAFLEAKHLVKQKLKQAHDRYIEEILGLTNSLEQPEPNCQSSPEPHKSTLASKKLFSLLKNSKQDSKGIAPLKKDGKLHSNCGQGKRPEPTVSVSIHTKVSVETEPVSFHGCAGPL